MIKVTSLYSHDIIWFYFSGLQDKIFRRKRLSTGAFFFFFFFVRVHRDMGQGYTQV